MSGAPGWAAEILGAIGDARLVEVRDALAKDRVDLEDRDAVLLHRAGGALLRELVPEGGPADAVNAYGALLHMLLLAWHHDWPTRFPPFAWRELPARTVWAQPFDRAAYEPLNGLFTHQRGGTLRVLAILGQHPARDGFTTLEAEAPQPLEPPPARPDGSAPFSSLMPGGDRAGLTSLASAHELVAYALRAVAAENAAG